MEYPILLIFVRLWDSTLLSLKRCGLVPDSNPVFCVRDRCRCSPVWTALLLKQQWWVPRVNKRTNQSFLRWFEFPSADPPVTVSNQKVQFDRYLSSPDTLVMPQLNFLLSAAIKWVFLLNAALTVWEKKEKQQLFTACHSVPTGRKLEQRLVEIIFSIH